jgi:acyl-CoA synthetase (AMP-forming)/AMP-acid ligase II
MMRPAPLASRTAEPFTRFHLDGLVAGAARLLPDRPALLQSSSALAEAPSFALLDAQISALAAQWRVLGLAPGERILVFAGARAYSIVAWLAGLRAGLDVAMAPLHLPLDALMAATRRLGVAALIGEVHHGAAPPIGMLFAAAAGASSVRLVCSLGPDAIDGAVPLDPAALASTAPAPRRSGGGIARTITFTDTGTPVFHRQSTLFTAALDFVSRGRIGTDLPIVSMLPPSSFAGLVAGPVASLVAGAPLALHGAFEGRDFVGTLDALGPVHLVVPVVVANDVVAAKLAEREHLASLILVSRRAVGSSAAATLPRCAASVPLFDLYAVGESAAILEPRSADGSAVEPAATAHYLALAGRSSLAVGRRDHAQGGTFEGAAVSRANGAQSV